MNSKVSVIIPCFNQGVYIEDLINSLRAQSHENWEALIVDDGSTDNTARISIQLGHEDNRIKYIYKENGGLSSARNEGLRSCSGEFVQFLDCDDLVDHRKFEVQAGFLRDNPDAGLVYGNVRYFSDGNFGCFSRGPYSKGPDDDWIAALWAEPRPIQRKLIEANMFPVCAPLLRRSIVEHVGYFDENLIALEDWDYWIRCASAGVVFQFVPGEGTDAFIRMHPHSMSCDVSRMTSAELRMREKYHGLLCAGELRVSNLVRLLPCLQGLPELERSRRFARILGDCHNVREYMIVSIGRYCSVGGALHTPANFFCAFLPESVRHRFFSLGLRI